VAYLDMLETPEDQLVLFEMVLLHTRLPNGRLESFTKCKYVGVRAHNTDYVDHAAAQRQGIIVSGIPQAGANAVAEHTFSLIFAVAKQLLQSNQNVREGKWRKGLRPNLELRGKNLGIIGYGTIGRQVAVIGRALGMNIYIASRSVCEGQLTMDEVLQQSDIVTLHASTKNNSEPLISRSQLEKMKDGAILINTARGSLLHAGDLENALRSGKLFGAGLDVHPEEPYINKALYELPNVVCTPHVAFYTRDTIERMNQYLVEQAIDFYAGYDEN